MSEAPERRSDDTTIEWFVDDRNPDVRALLRVIEGMQVEKRAAEAAAYERAVEHISETCVVNPCNPRTRSYNRGVTDSIEALRALIDPDAASALDAVRAEVRRECAEILMREALNIRTRERGYYGYGGPDPRVESARKEQSAKAILLERLAATIREGRWQ